MTRKPAAPKRIHHPNAERCGRNVVWCGPGSPWDNPWRARRPDRYVWMAVKSAHVMVNNPPTIHAGSLICGPRPPDARELALAVMSLYRVWIFGRVDHLRRHLQTEMRFAMAGIDAAAPFPDPPTFEAIRAALRGRHLADVAPVRHASHVGVLLEIANATDAEAPGTA